MFFLKELPSRAILQSYAERFPQMDVDAVEKALSMLRNASLLLRELEAYFASHGLSQSRFLTLIVIDREPKRKGLLPSEIADRLDISRPVVTDTVRALKRGGLLETAKVEHDGRAKLICLTAAGRERLQALLPGYYGIISRFMSKI
ncbi:MAG: MarR family transcriptional regulator [Pseudomonadota bacterium]|nr:MarR family transcriptional regulator [Pseudomonadota bacterium]